MFFTEAEIVQTLLVEGPKTFEELKFAAAKTTRTHVGEALQNLFGKGVLKSSNKVPFKYSLSNPGNHFQRRTN